VLFNVLNGIVKKTDPCCHSNENLVILTLSYTNFIVLRIYAEALDRLRVRLNMYLVIKESLTNFIPIRFETTDIWAFSKTVTPTAR